MCPLAVIVAGPNGAGKTTFALEYKNTLGFPYLSADAIAGEITPRTEAIRRMRTGRLFFRALLEQIGRGESFLVETTLAGRGFHRLFRRLEEAGFSTTIMYVFLESPALCVARIKARVAKGGHNIPDEDVLRRFGRSLDNFWNRYRMMANHWHLFYNGARQFQEVAMGERDAVEVMDEGLFRTFLGALRITERE